ncbi:MAG: hypothetical protein SGJ27_18965 [Candidatus Melainabacteria bacterium]|nr:hypothetical protein [Candidatus Melainabacteria bacterium]
MLDVRKPMGLLFVILGALLFVYGYFFSEAVPFYTPDSWFPLKLNQPVGAFMFIFGAMMLALARFVQLHTADRELGERERELNRAERKRQRAIAKRELAAGAPDDSADAIPGELEDDAPGELASASDPGSTLSKSDDPSSTLAKSHDANSAGGSSADQKSDDITPTKTSEE